MSTSSNNNNSDGDIANEFNNWGCSLSLLVEDNNMTTQQIYQQKKDEKLK